MNRFEIELLGQRNFIHRPRQVRRFNMPFDDGSGDIKTGPVDANLRFEEKLCHYGLQAWVVGAVHFRFSEW
jgi:hypothetical protein